MSNCHLIRQRLLSTLIREASICSEHHVRFMVAQEVQKKGGMRALSPKQAIYATLSKAQGAFWKWG